jgi:hypothetical protein
VRRALLIAALLSTPAHAADTLTCGLYAQKVEKLVMILTNDLDVAQAANNRAEAYCGVIDFPVDVQFQTIVEKAALAPDQSTWAKACKARYRSFRASDGTVILRGHRTRSPCPVEK